MKKKKKKGKGRLSSCFRIEMQSDWCGQERGGVWFSFAFAVGAGLPMMERLAADCRRWGELDGGARMEGERGKPGKDVGDCVGRLGNWDDVMLRAI